MWRGEKKLPRFLSGSLEWTPEASNFNVWRIYTMEDSYQSVSLMKQAYGATSANPVLSFSSFCQDCRPAVIPFEGNPKTCPAASSSEGFAKAFLPPVAMGIAFFASGVLATATAVLLFVFFTGRKVSGKNAKIVAPSVAAKYSALRSDDLDSPGARVAGRSIRGRQNEDIFNDLNSIENEPFDNTDDYEDDSSSDYGARGGISRNVEMMEMK